MYKPAVTQILFVSKFTADTSNCWLSSLLPFTSLHCFPTHPVCAWPSQTQHPLTALVFFCQLGLCLFSVLVHTPFVFPSSFLFLPSFLFPPSFFFLFVILSLPLFPPSLSLLFLYLIIILVSRCLKIYNTE